MQRHRPILLRYCLLSMCLTIPLLTGIVAWLTATRLRDDRIEEATHTAVEIAAGIELRLRSIPDDSPAAERSRLAREALDLGALGHGVARMHVFDAGGRIMYSSVPHLAGRVPEGDHAPLRRAIAGEVSSAILPDHARYDTGDDSSSEALLETYVPVPRRPGDSIAAIEVYQDASRLLTSVASGRRWVAFVAALCMGFQVGIFALIALRADRLLKARESELLSSNRRLEDLSHGLEEQVAERGRRLAEHEKLASLGTLAAGVAHEINNPLATIATCVDGSLRRLRSDAASAENRQELEEYLGVIHREVYRCKRITENLLDFSRQDAVVVHGPVDPAAVVRDAVDLCRLGTDARGVDLLVDCEDGIIGVLGDPVRLKQAIFNMVSNALDAVADLEDARILVRAVAAGGEAHIECIDNGGGVPDELRERVYEPFFTTKPSDRGTGLGLAVTYSIAQRHGGTLTLIGPDEQLTSDCWEGPVGARFRLALPLRARAEPLPGPGGTDAST